VKLDDLDPPPADGAVVLDAVHDALTRYVVFPCPEAADAATLYAAATHVQGKLEFAARLVIKSPAKRCGKSRLLDVLGCLVASPLLTSDISAAALVRSITKDAPPVLLLDEADATFGKALKGDEKAEHLRGILNAGFGRDRPYRRWDVTIRDVEECETFAMAVLAGIGNLPDTIEDRAIVIAMRRKTAAEPVAKFRIRRDKPKVTEVRDQLAVWASAVAEQAGEAEPAMPDEMDDRAQDVWEAAVAIADLAGAAWPARARRAALVLSAARDTDTTMGERLLADLRAVFGAEDRMHTETILAKLHLITEALWRDWYGRPFNARDLAGLLKPYGISSKDVKIDGVTKKGYQREQFHEPWTRYLPPVPGGSATSATSVTAQVSGQMANATQALPSATGQDAHEPPASEVALGSAQVADAKAPLTSEVAQVAEVADTPPAGGRCTICGEPLDQVLIDAGLTDHGETGQSPDADADEPDPGVRGWQPPW
jgi:hypothetical protein